MKATPNRPAVVTAAGSGIATATADPDADLIKKCEAWKEANDRTTGCDDDATARDSVREFRELAMQIARTPATTEAGIAAKMQALVHNANEEDFDLEQGLDEYESVQISVLCDLRDRAHPRQKGPAA